MTAHLLVNQLRFTRGELQRGLAGLGEEDAQRRIDRMNCISWMVGHLANQERRYWISFAQGQEILPQLNDLVGYNKPASTPPLEEMLAAWRTITAEADRYLDTLTPAKLQDYLSYKGKALDENIGTMLMRNIYHYWYHIGEMQAVRQLLGHANLAEYVGDMDSASYYPEE